MENKFLQLLHSNEKKIGTIASIVAILMVLSSTEILISNLKGNSHIFIQPCVTTLNGIVWSLYAYLKKDLYILMPNILASIIAFATVVSAFI